MRRRWWYGLYLVAVVAIAIAAVELSAFAILKARGMEAPLFVNATMRGKVSSEEQALDSFKSIDPHLGYTHGKTEKSVGALSPDFTWEDGFLIYAKDTSHLQRPIILALGGSTTDGVTSGHSWPEELAATLKAKDYFGTVINGGYSTNQELLKLVRDGLEFSPDIVISYNGINNRGFYSELPYPMVHRYQRKLIKAITGQAPPKILPNTVLLLRLWTDAAAGAPPLDYSFGLKSHRSLSGQYRKNMELMFAICQSQGASFDAFIQPFAFYKSKYAQIVDPASKGATYIDDVLRLYEQIVNLPKTHKYIHDATQILEDSEGAYRPDGVHLTEAGDKVVAQYIFSFLEPKLQYAKRH